MTKLMQISPPTTEFSTEFQGPTSQRGGVQLSLFLSTRESDCVIDQSRIVEAGDQHPKPDLISHRT